MANKEGQQFGQLMTAMVTPLDDYGEFSVERTRNLARHLADTGTDTIVVSGTTGESPTLRMSRKFEEHERMLLLTTVLQEVGHKCKVVAGTSTYDTEESIELSRLAQGEGADGLLLVTPYYNKPSQEGIYRHFAAIANSVDKPIVLYNVPGRTGVNMKPPTVFRLDRDFPHVIGIKEAVGRKDAGEKQILDVLTGVSEGFGRWSGNDQDTLFFLMHGGDGVVSVASHLCGTEIKEMISSYFRGDTSKAEEFNERLMPYFNALFPNELTDEPSPSQIKTSCNDNGLPVGGLRLPLWGVPESYRQHLQTVFTSCGLAPVGQTNA